MSIGRRISGFGHIVSSESLTVTNASTETLVVPAGVVSALISVDGFPVRFRVDGNSPTTTVGHYLDAGDYFEMMRPEILAVEFIAVVSNATVFVTYYGG